MISFVLCAQNKSLRNNDHKVIGSSKIMANPTQSIMDINNITSWVAQDGFHDWVVSGGWNGSFPNSGDWIGAIFCEGIVWGGRVNDGNTPTVRVNGSTYMSGCAPTTRVFRVRPDYLTADLILDAANFFNTTIGSVTQEQINELRQQYSTDWSEWPADQGAIFKDVNEDGEYDPTVDIPGVPGASQTLFIKYDDSFSQILYSSPPIGLEISETYWAYSSAGALGNIIYKKVNLVYSGTSSTPPASSIDDMYICQWADPDLGNSTDDFVGCDSTMNLGYVYNSGPTDVVYNLIGLNPPAVGYSILQGASEYTGNPNDSSIINFQWRHGYRFVNPKPMNSFTYFAAGGSWSDPAFTYTGTLEFYNLMRGYLPDPPYPSAETFPSSVADYTNDGVYLLAGDPITGIGKIDGTFDVAGDRRMLCASGPYHMDLNDTAEIVSALVAGLGSSYLNSIVSLKENVYIADTTFLGFVSSGQVQVVNIEGGSRDMQNPRSFILRQNYPNPFNPSTEIEYRITKPENVSLKIYDILGDEIETLVDKEQTVGTYKVNFDAKNLSSGIYFYQLKTGDFVQTKKMILLK